MYIIIARADAKTSRNLVDYAENSENIAKYRSGSYNLVAVLLECKYSENQINPAVVPVENNK